MNRWIKSHPIPFFVAITSLLAFLLVMLGRIFYGSSFVQDFASNWLATFLGVIVGVPTALFLAEYQEKNTEREHREKILFLIKEDLENNLEIMKSWKETDGSVFNIRPLAFDLGSELWEAFSDGGELQWIKDPGLLGLVAEAFSSIKSLKAYIDWGLAEKSLTQIARRKIELEFELCMDTIENTVRYLKTIE